MSYHISPHPAQPAPFLGLGYGEFVDVPFCRLSRRTGAGSPAVKGQLDVLTVCSRIENRRTLQRTFEGLPVNTFYVSTVALAVEVLSSRTLAVIFCEELLPDASYRELLRIAQINSPKTRFVVMLSTGEWQEYLEALKLGVAEVIRCPLQPPDIDMALIHAIREGGQNPEMYAAGA